MLPKAGFRGGFTLSRPRARKSCRRRGLLLVSTWRGAPVLQHHPPALGVCLSLKWMQPSRFCLLSACRQHLVIIITRSFSFSACACLSEVTVTSASHAPFVSLRGASTPISVFSRNPRANIIKQVFTHLSLGHVCVASRSFNTNQCSVSTTRHVPGKTKGRGVIRVEPSVLGRLHLMDPLTVFDCRKFKVRSHFGVDTVVS